MPEEWLSNKKAAIISSLFKLSSTVNGCYKIVSKSYDVNYENEYITNVGFA